MMHATVLLPTKIMMKKDVIKIRAEAIDGHFVLLPKHVDFVAPLVSGILILTQTDHKNTYLAIDGGTLVKKHDQVWISTPRALFDDDIEQLEKHISEQWTLIKESEEKAKSAMAKLESDTLRRFMEWRKI
jgi:F-type H+-transporting ATPase subunit epsilon